MLYCWHFAYQPHLAGLTHLRMCVEQEIARHLRPCTLRAVFGKSKIQNAVHCTDLPEDGLLEVSRKHLLGAQVHEYAQQSWCVRTS